MNKVISDIHELIFSSVQFFILFIMTLVSFELFEWQV